MTTCSFVTGTRLVQVPVFQYCPYQLPLYSTLKMDAACSLEMLVTKY